MLFGGVPALYRSVFVRAYGGGSRTAGIKAFCLDCVGFQRSDITNCTALACPLWPYRPYQGGDEDTDATESGQDTVETEPRLKGSAVERDAGMNALRERTCAICHRGGSTTPVTLALKWLGIHGNYAHPKCLKKARKDAALAQPATSKD